MSKAYQSDPETLGLRPVLERALRASFHQRRDTAQGWDSSQPLTWDAWRRVKPLDKDELRTVEEPLRDFNIADPSDVVGFWRSGGVTGRPIFYPRTADDIDASLDAFMRTLVAAGVTADDVVHISLPIGIHPAGQQMARAAEMLGAAVVWAGGGTQTPTAEQARLARELGVTVWIGMPGFGLTIAQRALDEGWSLSDGPTRLLVTTAERMSGPKRARLSELWGAEVIDMFGMSELTLLGLECVGEGGFHLWDDVVLCEVLDEDTLEPVDDGTAGLLCVTPRTTGHATPFVRWLSGDVVSIGDDCGCSLRQHPRVVHTGRLQRFFKVRGTNVGHEELEALLLGLDVVADFRAIARDSNELHIEVECRGSADDVPSDISERVRDTFGIRPSVEVVERGTIERIVAADVKAQRFVDEDSLSAVAR